MVHIPVVHNEIRSLVVERNAMAHFLHAKDTLPPLLKNVHQCQRCYALDSCLVYHKSVENGESVSSGLGSVFDKRVGHMSEKHAAFFEKWERLITQEEGDLHRLRKELWTLTSDERYAAGRYLFSMYSISMCI
jgi:DNA replication ATP-dependent helicase Dna2